jgi:hypothetical protein
MEKPLVDGISNTLTPLFPYLHKNNGIRAAVFGAALVLREHLEK